MKTEIKYTRKKTYSTDSIVVAEELKARDELHKQCTAEISEALLYIDAQKEKLPPEVVTAINTIIWNTQILLRENQQHRPTKTHGRVAKKKKVAEKKEETKEDTPESIAKNIEAVEKFDKKKPLYAEVRDMIALKTGSFRIRIREAMNEKGIVDEDEIEKARKAIQIYFNRLVAIEKSKEEKV